MLSFLTVLAMHVPTSEYLRCKDFDWLANRLARSELFTPAEKFDLLVHWMNHTDPHCFDNKDAKAD
jgi:hypothetical protein